MGMLNNVMYDAFYRRRPAENQEKGPIVIIAVDDRSLDMVDQQTGIGWPWPRMIWGAVIQFCNAHGAKAVAFDLTFSQHAVSVTIRLWRRRRISRGFRWCSRTWNWPTVAGIGSRRRAKKKPVFGAVNFDQDVARWYIPGHGEGKRFAGDGDDQGGRSGGEVADHAAVSVAVLHPPRRRAPLPS